MSLNEEEIYQEHVLDHYEDPYHRGRLDHPTHHHEDDNPLCGDVVGIDLTIDPGGVIREAWFDGGGLLHQSGVRIDADGNNRWKGCRFHQAANR